MSKAEKRFARMKNNPKGDWQIADIEAVCRHYAIECEAPTRGSHYTVSHETQAEILTIPAHKPIKAVYIVRLVSFIESVIGSES